MNIDLNILDDEGTKDVDSYSTPLYCENCGYVWNQYAKKGNLIALVAGGENYNHAFCVEISDREYYEGGVSMEGRAPIICPNCHNSSSVKKKLVEKTGKD